MKKAIILFLSIAFVAYHTPLQAQIVTVTSPKKSQHQNEALKLKAAMADIKSALDDMIDEYSEEVSVNENNIQYLEILIRDISNTLETATEEIHWSRTPLSSLCGFYTNRAGGDKKCQGHTPRYSCPDGYKKSVLLFESGGDGYFAVCAKERNVAEDVSWQKMPAGSLCGFTTTSHGGNQVSRADCLGHNPHYTCPPGFKKTSTYMESSGDGYLSYCLKL